jgi:hypothetical protein
MSDDSGSPPEEPKICVATAEYIARQNDEMSLEVDDVIEISLLLEDGWMKGRKLFGHQESGCFPSNHVRIIQSSSNARKTLCKTLFDYEAQSADELSFGEGELIKILKTVVDQGWMYGSLMSNGNVGVFPTNYVRFLTDSEADIEFLFNAENEGGNGSGEEADKENMKDGNKTATPQGSPIESMIQRMQQQSLADKSFVSQDDQPTPSAPVTSKNDETEKNDEVVQQNDRSQEQQLVRSSSSSLPYTNPLLFQVVNDPTVIDYEYHIEEDENGTRPGCTTYTATVKWTVKTAR